MTEMAADFKLSDDETGKPYKDAPINDQTKSIDASVKKGNRAEIFMKVVAALLFIAIIVLTLFFSLRGKEEVEEIVKDVVEKVYS